MQNIKMEQEIYEISQQFEKECTNFVKRFILCRRIVVKLTEAVFKSEVRDEAKIQTTEEVKEFLDAVKRNLNIFMALLEKYNKNTDDSFSELVSIKNDLTLFTYGRFDSSPYKENVTGECIITNIRNSRSGCCHINDLQRPKPQLSSISRKYLEQFPKSGEIFAINWKDQELLRAVRNDLIFKEQEKIIVYLVDNGQRVEIPYNLKCFFALPKEFHGMESRAIPCKVIKLIDENGSPLDVQTNLHGLRNKICHFEIKKVENDTLWIKLQLKLNDSNIKETANSQAYLDPCDIEVTNNESLSTEDTNEEQTAHSSAKLGKSATNSVLTCDICQSNFATIKEIETHMHLHSLNETVSLLKKQKSPVIVCTLCKQTFRLNIQLKQHLKSHVAKEPHTLQFSEKAINKENSLQCLEGTDTEMKSHTYQIENSLQCLKGTDTEMKPYTCEICEKAFSLKKVLDAHKKIHTGQRPHKCIECGAAFIHRHHLLSHAETHKITCKFCNKSFSKVSNFQRHIKSHKPKLIFFCDTCKKMFKTKKLLKRHLNSHTKEKSYPCRICGKHFFLQPSRLNHEKTHSEEKYDCHDCGKEFRYERNLQRHLKNHIGNKPFTCKTCNKGFIRKDNLRSHLRTHEG